MRAKFGDGLVPVIRMSVDARADGRAAEPDLAQELRLLVNGFLRALDRAGVSRELLAQPHGHRVLHVRAARLQDVVEFFAFLVKRGDEAVERGIKLLQLQQRRQPHGRRKNVVGGLPVVDVVVGMDVLVLAAHAAQQLRRRDWR